VKDILKIAFILLIVCGLAAGSLSFVNLATKDRIAAFAKEEKIAAFQKIFPGAQSFTRSPRRRKRGEGLGRGGGGAIVGSVHDLKPMGYSGRSSWCSARTCPDADGRAGPFPHRDAGSRGEGHHRCLGRPVQGEDPEPGRTEEGRPGGRHRCDLGGHDLLARGHPGDPRRHGGGN